MGIRRRKGLTTSTLVLTSPVRHHKRSSLGNIVLYWRRWRGRRVGPMPLYDMDRIQELDGGFFEKFGTGLQEQAEEDTAPVDDSTEAVPLDEEGDVDSGVELEEEDKKEFIKDAVGWNIEELYTEILYEILHIVGCDAEEERAPLYCYLQETFKLDDDKHNELLEIARSKEAPNILLNIEVIEAKDLKPKDANGTSDPFCTLYLTSAVSHRYNTSVKPQTLSPLWEEHFSLPVENPQEDTLCIEMWDFDPAETVREKMMKIGEVKGVRGFRKLIKEIAITASTGKHDNDFIGSHHIPLKNIPACGQTLWCQLEKKGKSKKQGDIKVHLAFSSEKNTKVASQEHRHLMRLMLLHELEDSKLQEENDGEADDGYDDNLDGKIFSKRWLLCPSVVEPYQWNGKFSSPAETILTQHQVQCGMSPLSVSLAQFVEFVNVHMDHPLSFIVFSILLQKLVKPLQVGLIKDDEEKIFWEAVKKLLPSCYNSIRKIRKLTHSEKTTIQQLVSILNILSLLDTLEAPRGINLFPSTVYGWLPSNENETEWDIASALREAVINGAEDWYAHILENNVAHESSEEAQLNHLIRVTQLVRTDLQKAMEFHDKIFHQTFNFPYSRTLYKLYESKIAELVEPVVTEVCKALKPLKFNNRPEDGIYDNDPLSMGTTLFELYLIVQRLAVLATALYPDETDDLQITKFHLWFHPGVAQWLDIALYKALQRIQKAVELDPLVPVDDSVKYSSSAVDTLAIFYQIKIFWKQLAWPDVEGSYTFIAKIIDDICRCSAFYADKMSAQVEGMGETVNVYEKKFEVTTEWCLAINNIDYVKQSIHPFVGELGMEEIVSSLTNFRSQTAAEHCRQTLQLVIDNTVDIVSNKILELLEKVADKMAPAISRFLQEGAELLHQDSNVVDKLMKYLDDNLATLYSYLNKDNFSRILSVIWENLARTIYELVENSLEKRRPPNFYQNLHETLNILVGFFKQGGETLLNTTDSEVLQQIQHLLQLHGSETWELIHQYHLERLKEQSLMEAATYGLLTVRAQFADDMLRIEILNARNLHPMDMNGSCDPFVKVHLLPEEKFTNITKPKTKTHKKTLFPLFDEIFTIHLSEEQRQLKDGLLLFSIKDSDFLGNECIGEAFLAFADIPRTEMTTGLEELDQVHLKISRPTKLATQMQRISSPSTSGRKRHLGVHQESRQWITADDGDSEVYRALESRQDKLATSFIKKLKQKLPT